MKIVKIICIVILVVVLGFVSYLGYEYITNKKDITKELTKNAPHVEIHYSNNNGE